MTPPIKNNVDWKDHAERSNTITLKLICWIAINIGRSFARIILFPITAYFYITSPKVRRASKNYFKRVLNKDANSITVIKHIYHFSATILDRVFFLTDKHNKFILNINGNETLDDYIQQGKGGILLGSHHGSFEVLRSLAIKNEKLKLKILMYRDHNQMITRIFDELNPAVAEMVINLADENALLQMQEAVADGYFIGMLGDRVTDGERKTPCYFLGDNVDFPAGPMLMACILNVPVLSFYGLYEGANKYDLYIEKVSEAFTVKRDERENKVQALTQQYASRLEYYVKKSPYNWFNFYDYWNDEAK